MRGMKSSMQDQAAHELLAHQAGRGQTIQQGLSMHSYQSQFSGGIVYQVCDAVCVVSTPFTRRAWSAHFA
ncbi:hypothetical protein CJO96_12795 [Ralstonia solanacearum]|nr:hypothetical protein CJO89_13335 [Ralstonia solanacearum]AXW71940.1 hypothetical protein CJO96_12795 [Ralstonia solanacearum]